MTERPLTALDAIYSRRSVRSYGPEPLEPSTVRALLDAAVQAPTAMHEQPWLFAVVQDRRLLAQLSETVKQSWKKTALDKAAPHISADASVHREFIARLEDPEFDVFYGAGTLIAICARRLDPFVVGDCWLAAENLMLAATALGLGTCCIGAALEALNAPEVKFVLRIPADVHAVVAIVVGVPDRPPAGAPRREPEILAWR